MVLVKDVADCETSAVRGLDQQLIDEINALVPNALVSIEDLNVEVAGSSVWPLVQLPAKEALQRAIDERGITLQVNSGYRTVAAQYMLYQQFQEGRCGITIAASPGSSNHEFGLALDIVDPEGWLPFLERQGWKWFGPEDDVHFDFKEGGNQDIVSKGVLAFQRLWNRNNPNDAIPEDGLYGDLTAARLGNSPAEGFPPPLQNEPRPLPPGIYSLKCLGTIEGPRFLNGITAEARVDLAPRVGGNFSGTIWEITYDETASAYRFRCQGNIEGARFLNGVTAEARVDLAPSPGGEFSGTNWEAAPVPDAPTSTYRFRCLGTIEGPRWLDGRTGEATVGLVDNIELSGTQWQVEPASTEPDPNAILRELTTTGASAETAGQDDLPPGVESSRTMAETDAPNVLRFVDRFQIAGAEYNLPPALLAAIASRESRGGTALNDGCLGDGGAGVGIMQVDQSVRDPDEVADPGPDCAGQKHLNQAASILRGFTDQATAAHPEWSVATQLQAGTASYNAGPDQIEKAPNFDEGTTGGDYSNDVWARAQFYADNWPLPAAVA